MKISGMLENKGISYAVDYEDAGHHSGGDITDLTSAIQLATRLFSTQAVKKEAEKAFLRGLSLVSSCVSFLCTTRYVK